jgi:uncharacterized Zn-finger protein
MKKEICKCGKKKYDFQDMCWQCKEEKEIKNIWEDSKEKGEVTYEKYIICPYCGNHCGEDDEHKPREIKCDECGKKFKMEIDYDITYSTYKLEEK